MAISIDEIAVVNLAQPLAIEAARIQRQLAEAGEEISISEAIAIVKAVQHRTAGQQPAIVARLAAIHRSQRGRLGFVLSYADAVREVTTNLNGGN
ncbi:MAG: hypothetical protein ACR2IF_05230 [Terriglobales bacterium]